MKKPAVTGPLIGTHVSIAQGVDKAIARAEEIGCTAMQIFTRNANRWQTPPLAEETVAAFHSARAAGSICYIAAHSSYLINLASPDPALRHRSLDACRDELDRCRRLGTNALVIHPGAHMGQGSRAGIDMVIRSLRTLLSDCDDTVQVLLENTAGQGTLLGGPLEELAEILARIDDRRLGVCLDTCHAFAAGYDLRHAAGYHALMTRVDQLMGVERLALFHVNDSKTPLGSRLDRHDHPGRGLIGREGFALLMRDRRFSQCAKITETPPGSEHCDDLENLALLRDLASSGTEG